MAIGNPYIERNVYSPQATATRGLRTRVPTRLTGSFQRAGMIPTIEQELVEPTPLRTQAAIFAPDATLASGGVAGDIGGGPPGDSDFGGVPALSTPEGFHPVPGFIAAAQKGQKGKATMDFLSMTGPLGLAKQVVWEPIMQTIKAHNEQEFAAKQAEEFVLDTTPVTNPSTGLPVGFIGPGIPAGPPVSSLADVDFGGGFGGGAIGMGDVGGPDADAGVVGF